MSLPVVVLVAEARSLPAIRARLISRGRLLCFSHAELPTALETIRAHRPEFLALESSFAATPKGREFAARVQAVAQFPADIRVVSETGDERPFEPPSPEGAIAVSTGLANTRRAPRFPVASPTEALVDGNVTSLVNLSVIGLQVISDPVLRPHQRVTIALPDLDQRILRFHAQVAWSVYEKPHGMPNPHYRAGVEFSDATAKALEDYCSRHCTKGDVG